MLFLASEGLRPLFIEANRQLTTETAKRTVALYRSLVNRGVEAPGVLQSFILQMAWCLFASSLGLLPGRPVQRIVRSLLADHAGKRSSTAELGHLFGLAADDELRGRGGVYAQTLYVNGGLFEEAARVHLEREELALLAEVAAYDWGQVEPTVFGSLLEAGRDRCRSRTHDAVDDHGTTAGGERRPVLSRANAWERRLRHL